MKSKPLSEANDPKLITRAYNLGLKLVPNLIHVLTEEELEYWENNMHQLKSAVRNGMTIPVRPPVGCYFMTVRLGVHKSTAELKQAILASGKKISNYADQILNKIQISKEEIEMDLYEVSDAELGFASATPRGDIYNRAFGYGFKECPGEGGGLARIQCADKKWRLIGMEPATDAGGVLSVLRLLGDDGGLWLGALCDHPGNLWSPTMSGSSSGLGANSTLDWVS